MGLCIADHFSCFGLVYFVLVNVIVVNCYNLDTRTPVIRTGENGTFFGFSVAIHSVGDNDMLIVGAPRGDSGLSQSTGAIYKCPVLPFDESTCERVSEETNEITRNKTDQWLGATVRSAGADDTVVACAPFSKEIRTPTGVHPSGKCFFYSNDFTHQNPIAPCQPRPNNLAESAFKFKSHCLAGISVETIGNDFVIGGPGSYSAQGSIFTLDGSNYITPDEAPAASDGVYQGYSVAYGNFSTNDEMDIVTGVPRGGMLLGLVRIYSKQMVLLKELEGYQTGSYFGESVAGSDLNDDGLDDLVVGASNYWNRETHQIDVGQVNIFYQTSLGTFDVSTTVITGQYDRGRFGLVVTALGDINNDGVNDLAVGAPYEGNGAVYIYNGRRGEKIKTNPSQVLRPSDFMNVPLKRFGFALSANRDADKNLYPDLLVGSYLSDTVVLFRTKPVIRPSIKITFESQRVHLKTKNVTWGGKLVSGFGGNICMSYSGLGTKDSYDFIITVTMDAEKQVARAELYEDQTTSNREIIKDSVMINKTDETQCIGFNAFLKDQLVDKISPITVRVSADVKQDLDNLPAGEIPHVIDVYTKVNNAQIPIFVNCLNERCSPDLRTSVKSDQPILHFGDDAKVSLTVTVVNAADEAFGAFLFVLLPDEARFLSFSLIKSDLSILCEMIHQARSVACDIGNPLPKKTEVVFEIFLQINPVPGDVTTLPITLLANSTSEEYLEMQADNIANFTWELQPLVGLLLDGSANIDQVIYNDTDVALNQIGSNDTDSTIKADKVIHTYWVQNHGPAKITSALLEVSWPMKTEDGTAYLLYLTGVSLNNGQECDVEGGIDPDNLYGDGNEIIGRTNKPQKRHGKSDVTAEDDDISREVSADCSQPGYSGCINITCSLGNMNNDGTNIILTIESRLMLDSLFQDNTPKAWDIKSSAVFTVQSIPYITQPEKTPSEVKTLSLRTIPLTFTQDQPLPLWAIILSVVLGALFLVIIVFVLYKCGFFQRNKIDLDELRSTYAKQMAEEDGSDMMIDATLDT